MTSSPGDRLVSSGSDDVPLRSWRHNRGASHRLIGIGAAILYLIVAFTLGLMTLRNGHGWMFFFGIFFPVLWIIGAFMRPPDTAAAV